MSNSETVLGGGSWYNYDPVKLSKLLISATNFGISSIDTAPSYGNSEFLLGKCLAETNGFKISTKVGESGSNRLTGKMVVKSIENSLKSLKLEKLNYIYLHSVDFKFVEDSAFDEMVNLKTIGVTNNIGVSCDGDDFSRFFELAIFDGFMMTLNLVDQANFENLLMASNAGIDVTLKRSLANGVFSNSIKARLIRAQRIYKGEILGDEVQSYDFRSRSMSSINGKRLKYSDYVRYVYSIAYKFNSNILIGTRSVEHLRKFEESKKEFKYNNLDFEKLRSLYLLADSYNWLPKV
jgi:aryl-alcohol dehydrogenase-like predicted oxidoreductase